MTDMYNNFDSGYDWTGTYWRVGHESYNYNLSVLLENTKLIKKLFPKLICKRRSALNFEQRLKELIEENKEATIELIYNKVKDERLLMVFSFLLNKPKKISNKFKETIFESEGLLKKQNIIKWLKEYPEDKKEFSQKVRTLEEAIEWTQTISLEEGPYFIEKFRKKKNKKGYKGKLKSGKYKKLLKIYTKLKEKERRGEYCYTSKDYLNDQLYYKDGFIQDAPTYNTTITTSGTFIQDSQTSFYYYDLNTE